MRSFLSCTFLLAAVALASAAGPNFVIGMELSYPPFEMRDASGAPAGVSVDLAKALGEKLGQPVEIQNLPFAGLIPALKTARDRPHHFLDDRDARARAIDRLLGTVLKTGLSLLVAAKSDIQSIAEDATRRAAPSPSSRAPPHTSSPDKKSRSRASSSSINPPRASSKSRRENPTPSSSIK